MGDLLIVVGTEKEIDVFAYNSEEAAPSQPVPISELYERAAKASLSNKVYSICIMQRDDNNEASVAAFDVNGGISFFALVDLTKIHFLSSSPHVRFTPSRDGIIYGVKHEGIFKASIFTGEFRPVTPSVFVEGLTMPPPPKSGMLKSLFGKQAANLDELFGREESFKPEPEAAKGNAEGQQGAAGQPRSIEEIKAKYGHPTRSTADTLAQTRQALDERGEKLAELSDKSADMAVASEQFLENIKKLTEKQNNSWW